MKRIHFIGGEKGGVGKSMTTRLLAQYHIDHKLPFCGFDSDGSHATFSRFYGEFTQPLAVNDFSSLDNIIAVIESHPDRDIIIDLAAQTRAPLLKWMQESDALDLFLELGIHPHIWHVMDDSADALSLLTKTVMDFSEHKVQFVVVENLGRGEDFSYFHQSETLDKLKEYGVFVVTLKKLQTALSRKVDFNNMSFWAAANNIGTLSIAERKRVKVWLDDTYKQFGRILEAKPELELEVTY